MAVSSKPDVSKELVTLQLTFKQQLPDKLAEIERLWEMFGQNETGDANLADLHRLAHNLAGSGGTFGAVTVSAVARDLEQTVKSLLNRHGQAASVSSVIQQQINGLLSKLGQVADKWQPSNIPYIQPGEPKGQRDSNLIYLAEDDELLAAGLIANLEQADYRVRHFAELGDF